MACELRKVYMYIFSIICVMATFGMCGYWVYKFYLNEDSTLVNYKKFYQDEDDIYPTLSLCLQNPFLKKELAKYGANESLYLAFLKGERYSREMAVINYTRVTIDIASFIKAYRIYYRNNTFHSFESGLTSNDKKKLMTNSFNGIADSYQLFYKCFSLEMPKIKDMKIFRVLLSNKIFPNGTRPSKYGLKTFVHLPKQFLLSGYTEKWIWPARTSNEGYKMRFLLDSIEIVTKRKKSGSTCGEDNWKRYDDWVIKLHQNITKCNNPYLNSLEHLSSCDSTELILESAISNTLVESKNYEKPCKTMEMVRIQYVESTVEDEKEQFWFSIAFPKNRFKEIIQTRFDICRLRPDKISCNLLK